MHFRPPTTQPCVPRSDENTPDFFSVFCCCFFFDHLGNWGGGGGFSVPTQLSLWEFRKWQPSLLGDFHRLFFQVNLRWLFFSPSSFMVGPATHSTKTPILFYPIRLCHPTGQVLMTFCWLVHSPGSPCTVFASVRASALLFQSVLSVCFSFSLQGDPFRRPPIRFRLFAPTNREIFPFNFLCPPSHLP